MNSRILWVAGGACLLLATGGLLLKRGKDESHAVSRDAEKAAVAPLKPDTVPAPSPQPSPPAVPVVEKLSDEQRTAILGKIEEASVTYDPKGLPLIEPYLLHPDPEVRAAALNGMIVLGEAGASPMLREAAKKAPTPKEAVALTEAADYLELPPGSLIPEERTAEGTRVPNAGDAAKRSRPKLGNPSRPENRVPPDASR